MDTRSIVLVMAVSAATVMPTTAFAQRRGAATTADPGQNQNLLALGHQQFDDLHYEEAIQTLSAALIRRGNTRESEVQIYELLALSYQAVNRSDEAEGAYRLVLARDPNHALSTDIAPRIIDFFNGVKQRWIAEGRPGLPRQDAPQVVAVQPVTIEHRSPAQQTRNTAVPLAANLVDAGHRVSRLVLAYRQGSHGLFTRVTTADGGNGAYSVTIPAEAVRPPLVEYYFEAVDANGVPVQARGDAFAPLRVAVPQPGGVPGWVWPVGGVVVAAAIAGVVIVGVVVSSNSQPANLTIDVQGH